MASPAVYAAVATALGMATAGSVSIETLARFKPTTDWSKTRRSVHTWWPVIATGTALVLSGPWIATLLVAALSAQLVHEYTRLTLGPADAALRAACLVFIPIHFVIVVTLPDWMTVAALGWALLVLPVVRMFSGSLEGFTSAVARAQWGVLTAVWGIGHLAWVLHLQLELVASVDLVAFVLLVTFSGDAMQWVWGKLLGRTPLVPTVSPKKTWEGLAGGLLTVVAVGAVIGPFIGLTVGIAAVLAGIVVVVGLLGDLVVSAIKRDAGAKDSGALLPGQGGLMDRLDGVLFTAPVAIQIVVWLG